MFNCVLVLLLLLPGSETLQGSDHRSWVAFDGPLLMEGAGVDTSIVLMSQDGRVLDGPVPMPPGKSIDLLPIMPSLATLDEAAYLQKLRENRPVGTPMVVVPALSRRVPIMERVETPGRGAWDRVAGWLDEGADDHDDMPEDAGRINGAALEASVPRDEVVIRSGWWIRPEMDVVMETDHGSVRFDLREDAAPMTCLNFTDLVEQGFYDGTIAHRILIKGRNGRPFVVQGGDPTGTGSGGPGWWLPLEPSTLGHDFGVLSMARADDPDSAGSQWFIALDRSETARLDGQYCAFAEAVDGGTAIVSMAMTPVGDSDYLSSRPVNPPVVKRMWIDPAPPRQPDTGRPDERVLPPTDGPWSPGQGT